MNQTRYNAEVDGLIGMIRSYDPEYHGELNAYDRAHLAYCEESLNDLCILGFVQEDTEHRNELRRNFVRVASELNVMGINPRTLLGV